MTLYVLVYGRLPFNGSLPRDVIHSVLHDELNFPELPVVAPGVRAVIERLLDRNPSTRMTLSQFRAEVKAFLRNLDSQNALPKVLDDEGTPGQDLDATTTGLPDAPSSDESPAADEPTDLVGKASMKPRLISVTEEEAQSSVARRRLSFGLVGYSSPLVSTRSGFQSRRGTLDYSMGSPNVLPQELMVSRSPRHALSEFVFPPICPGAPNSPKGSSVGSHGKGDSLSDNQRVSFDI